MIDHELHRIFDRPELRAFHRTGVIQHEREVEWHTRLSPRRDWVRLHQHVGKLAAPCYGHALATYLTVQSYFAGHLISPFPFSCHHHAVIRDHMSVGPRTQNCVPLTCTQGYLRGLRMGWPS